MNEKETIYDYTTDQAALVAFYELHLCALSSRRYHGEKYERIRRLSNGLDTVAALSSSAAVASLAVWQTAQGAWVYGVLVVIAAVASVWKSAWRVAEQLDRHGRLAQSWSEIFLDVDRLLSQIRAVGELTAADRKRMDDLSIRFHRAEIGDDAAPDAGLRDRCENQARESLPVENRWLPSS